MVYSVCCYVGRTQEQDQQLCCLLVGDLLLHLHPLQLLGSCCFVQVEGLCYEGRALGALHLLWGQMELVMHVLVWEDLFPLGLEVQ